MKIKAIKLMRDKTVEILKKESDELKTKIEKARMDMLTAKEKDLKKVKNLTNDLSQILTIIREKEIMRKEDEKS
jgi:ribosomal protein L29